MLAPVQAFAAEDAIPAATAATSAAPDTTAIQEVVVNGIPYRNTVLPTRMTSNSVYGLNLSVMETPRNATLLSTTQLDTLNIKDPRAFSYLTASSYTDSAFGGPNVPRIRGQFGDVFVNGMRSSFSSSGYGAPISFNSIDTIDITKGPASVIEGPGPGVGGQANFITKRPSLTAFGGSVSGSVDTLEHHRWSVDLGGPIQTGKLGLRLSYSGEDSGSYFHNLYFRQNAVYAALRYSPNDRYRLDFNSEFISEQYTESVGLNRVSQDLIDHGLYLRGAPAGELFSDLIGSTPYQVGSPGNPYSPVPPILAVTPLGSPIAIDKRISIDQTNGTSARAYKYNAQLIQSYEFGNGVTVENNTFFDYENRDNQALYYYADSAKDSFSIETRFDAKGKHAFAGIDTDWIAGVDFRLQHVNAIENNGAEPVSVYDLTSNPALWVYSPAHQLADANGMLFKSAMGRYQYGAPGRDSVNNGATNDSNLYDTAVFFQQRLQFTPKLSVLFGARADAVQVHSHDPLGGPVFNGLPQDHTTGVYGLGNANLSVVYRFRPWVSGYATVDWTQTTNPNGDDGGFGLYGQVADAARMRADSYLYEAGLKFDLLNKKLFAGLTGFSQQRQVSTGQGGTQTTRANIRGFESELNYQPSRNFFATASYSYIDTTFTSPPSFYNYPAAPGELIDGAALFAVFAKGQSFEAPGIPQQIANLLVNYKFDNGVGLRFGAQATGPIQTTADGRLDLTASSYVPASILAAGGVYKAPRIPWQYTLNAAAFYEVSRYTFTFSVFNLTDKLNWQSSNAFYGNDFLVRTDPRSFEFRIQAKF